MCVCVWGMGVDSTAPATYTVQVQAFVGGGSPVTSLEADLRNLSW
jgi:hypothetical protein